MKVCPQCELDASNEYTDSAICCSECGTQLVDKLTFQSQINQPPLSLNKPVLVAAVLAIREIPVQDPPDSDVIALKVCPQCEYDASNEYLNSAKYCSKCGTELVDKLSLHSKKILLLSQLVILSVILGVPEIDISHKSKKTALLLAIFSGPFTWLYTYRRDALKAAIGSGLAASAFTAAIILFLIFRFFSRSYYYTDFPEVFVWMPFILVFVFAWMPISLWAIIDVIRQKEWSISGRATRNKDAAILLAVFLTPWTWFYTYNQDAWKFWFSFIFLNGGLLANWIFMSSQLPVLEEYVYNMDRVPPLLFSNLSLIIWGFIIIDLVIFLYSVIIVASRSSEWYQQFSQVKPRVGSE